MFLFLMLFHFSFAQSQEPISVVEVPWPTSVTQAWSDHKYHVVLFWSPHCGCIGRQKQFIYDFQKRYAKESMQILFVDIGSPDQKTTEKMAKLFKFKGVFINDHNRKITKALGAKVTPEAFIINDQNQIVYASAFVKEDLKSSKNSMPLLENALREILKSGKATVSKTEPEGCYIDPAEALSN